MKKLLTLLLSVLLLTSCTTTNKVVIDEKGSISIIIEDPIEAELIEASTSIGNINGTKQTTSEGVTTGTSESYEASQAESIDEQKVLCSVHKLFISVPHIEVDHPVVCVYPDYGPVSSIDYILYAYGIVL